MSNVSLGDFLEQFFASENQNFANATVVIQRLCETAILVSERVSLGALEAAFAGLHGGQNSDGDDQKELDVLADEMYLDALKGTPLAVYASEELPEPLVINEAGTLALSIDPIDGSGNIENNLSIGTIFSILPVVGDVSTDPENSILQTGRKQIAAGLIVFGPQLSLVLTVGTGTHIFVYSRKKGTFIQAYKDIKLGKDASQFTINASNYRHWDQQTRAYYDDCIAGKTGRRKKDFNMRWTASLVADAYRMLINNGIYIYRSDSREGYEDGRLRLIYECNPVAFIIEQAGGVALSDEGAVLDIQPKTLHQRAPFFFGSSGELNEYLSYYE